MQRKSAATVAALLFNGWRRGLVGGAGLGGAVEAGLIRRHGDGGALRVQQILLAGAEAQLDQRAGVREDLGLPVVVVLEADECFARGLVPFAGGFALEVVFADQRLLDFQGAGRVDGLLAVEAGPAAARACTVCALCPVAPWRAAESKWCEELGRERWAALCARTLE